MIKEQIQTTWIKADLKEMKTSKSKQACLIAEILREQKTYDLLNFWNNDYFKNSRRCMRALTGCDWLTPHNFSRPLYKCFGCKRPVTSQHLLFECRSNSVRTTREKVLNKLNQETANEIETLTLEEISKCLPNPEDDLCEISNKTKNFKELLKRIIHTGIGDQKTLIKYLTELLKKSDKILQENLEKNSDINTNKHDRKEVTQNKINFPTINILPWKDIKINNKYFVVHNDERHLEEFEMIVLKKAEYEKIKFVSLALPEFPNGPITKKFPTNFHSFTKTSIRNQGNRKKKRKITNTNIQINSNRPTKRQRHHRRDPMEIDTESEPE